MAIVNDISQTNRISRLAGTFIEPDPPCEEFNCDLYSSCKCKKLACNEFFIYVRTKKVVEPKSLPTHKIYLKVFEYGNIKQDM